MPTVKLIAWNLFLGGIDHRLPLGDIEDRRLGQLKFLASTDADVYWLTEAKGWHDENGRRFREAAIATGTVHLPAMTTRVGDGQNHSVMLYRPSTLREVTYSQLATGSLHHGAARAVFEADHARLLVLGTHLAYDSAAARTAEAHHFADYAGPFGEWPEDAVLLGSVRRIMAGAISGSPRQ